MTCMIIEKEEDVCQWKGCDEDVEYRVLPEPGSVVDKPLELCGVHYRKMIRLGMIEPVAEPYPVDPSCIDPTD